MEDKMRQVSAQNLECPICLNIFDDPKILSCSHTFCKGCLVQLQESQPNASKLPCPVCRGVTDIPEGNVNQMQSNIALKSLVEDVKSQHQHCTSCKSKETSEAVTFCQECGKYMCVACNSIHSQWGDFSDHPVLSMSDVMARNVSINRRRKCQKHPREDEEYFCSDCRMYVCFRCRTIDRHEREGHEIMEASQHEGIQRRNIEELEAKANVKVLAITKYIDFIEGERVELTGLAKKLDESVVSAYQEAVKQLTRRKELLREKIKEKFAVLERNVDTLVETSRQHIKNVIAVKELIGGGRKVPLEKEALTAYDTLCEDLKGLLGRVDPDYEKARQPNKSGRNILFKRNKGEDELELGRLEDGEWRCRDVALSKKDSMECMISIRDRMAVGSYLGGIEIFTADGNLQQTVLRGVKVRGLGYLSNGRYVVRNTANEINLYTAQCEKLDVTLKTPSNVKGGQGILAVGCEDHIYVSYKKTKTIQVFRPSGGAAVRKIVCDGYTPWQIFPMPTFKRLLVSCCIHSVMSVKLIDECGVVKSEATKRAGCNAFPAVCHDDSIIIAWVKHEEGMVTIDRYDSELNHVASLITNYKIQKPEKRKWYYLQEFVSGEIAFCTSDMLYIFYRSTNSL